MTRVLVVEDEVALGRALAINLRAHGYDVEAVADGAAALVVAARRPPDVVVLDLGLPDLDGVQVVEGLRGWSSVPIVVLSARHEREQKVAALDAGADDYVTKPFDLVELLARVRAAVRRGTPGAAAPARLETASFTVDFAAHRVRAADRDVQLTPTEWHVLEVLARHPGQLVTQRELLQQVWGPSYGSESNYLRVYVSQLR
ncbi:MAG TPA: response regulator, partial [Angustibacter sp.]|nr:response regulator [Angustibacter sp.]